MLQDNGFSVSRSRQSAGRISVEMTIEQTVNKLAKTKGGIDDVPEKDQRELRP